MKQDPTIITTELDKTNVVMKIRLLPANGKHEVVIRDVGNKTARQRGLQWRWFKDVANAGLGGRHEDTDVGVSLIFKYRFVLPVLERDDPNFSEIWTIWKENHLGQTHNIGDQDKILWFVDNVIHTESLTPGQMAEALTNFERYYLSKGVNLTIPPDKESLLALA